MQTESVNNSVVYEPIAGLYKLRFDDDVVHPSYYRFEIEALQRANENDKVEITINTDGGSLATGIEFTNEILQCKSPVHGILRANSHSCGSIVFLACDTHEVGIASEMLLHSGGGGTGGTPAQSVKRAESYKRQVKALFETVYKGFVTDEELDLMIEHDKEYIFSAEEIRERLQAMYKHRQSQQSSSLEDLFSEQEAQMDKMESVIQKKLLETEKLSEEELSVYKKVQEEMIAFDRSLSDEEFNSLMEEESQEEGSLGKFVLQEQQTTYSKVVNFKDTADNVWVLTKQEDTFFLDGIPAEEVYTYTDLSELCTLFKVKLPHNIKSEEKIIARIEKRLQEIWESGE